MEDPQKPKQNKVFIWSLEYELLIASAKSVKKARNILLEKVKNTIIDDFHDDEDRTEKLQFLEKEPTVIIEPNTGIILEHINL